MRSLVAVSAALMLVAAGQSPQEPPIRFRLGAEATEVRPGGTLVLTVTALIPRGWHLYGMRQPPGGPLPTVLEVGPEAVFSLASSVTSTPAKSEFDPNFGLLVEWHDDSAKFRVPLEASRRALPGAYRAQVRVSYQRCNDRICLPLVTDTLVVALTVGGAPEPERESPPTAPAAVAPPELRRLEQAPAVAAASPAAAAPADTGATERSGGAPPGLRAGAIALAVLTLLLLVLQRARSLLR